MGTIEAMVVIITVATVQRRVTVAGTVAIKGTVMHRNKFESIKSDYSFMFRYAGDRGYGNDKYGSYGSEKGYGGDEGYGKILGKFFSICF